MKWSLAAPLEVGERGVRKSIYSPLMSPHRPLRSALGRCRKASACDEWQENTELVFERDQCTRWIGPATHVRVIGK